MKLNLKATNPAEERIKAYLEANASESLARKINEGTPFVKDGTPLKNIKTLSGFMQYATKEAQKIAEKGARFACIDDTTVFGWSIHYFEEDAIEGNLFNADGTPYKAVITPKSEKTPKAPQKPLPKTEQKPTAQKTAKILPTAKVAEPTQEPPKKNPTPTQEKPKKKLIFTQVKSKPTEAYQSQPKPTTNTSYTVHEQISLFDMI